MNRTMKKLLCLTTAGVLGLSALAGCGSKKIEWNKTTFNRKRRYSNSRNRKFGASYEPGTDDVLYVHDGRRHNRHVEQKTEDGKTYGEQTKDSVLEQLKAMMLLKEHAADYKVSVSDEEKKSIEEAVKKFMEANTKETIEKLSVQQSDIEQLLTLFTYQNKMYDPMTADVDTNVEDTEAAQSAITYCKVSTADKTNEDGTTTPLTDEEKNEKKSTGTECLR